MSYSFIIPIYNEERAMPLLLSQIKTFANDHEILFINDGSNDRSFCVTMIAAYWINLLNFRLI